MSKHVGSIEIECDAPPYAVVQASRQAGIHTPEDVRWLRLDCRLPGRPGAPEEGQPVRMTCRCGEALPKPRTVVFAFAVGPPLTLLMAQCPKCRTVFWDEA
jgi:hypothetical protein